MREAENTNTRGSRPPPRPARTGGHRKAPSRVKPPPRVGPRGGTAPLGIATTTVMAALGGMAFWVKVAVGPLLVALVQGSVDRSGPLKHATWVMSAGASTLTLARWIGTVHPGPIALRFNSSWSGNPLRTPRSVYVMS